MKMLNRFMTVAEIREMPLAERATVITSMLFIFGVGVLFSVVFYMESGQWFSIIPAIGFYILAWERKG